MNSEEFYYEIFHNEYKNMEQVVFGNIKLASEWEDYKSRGLFHSVGICNDKVYRLFYRDGDGFLFVPEGINFNGDFDTVIRYSGSDKLINYIKYTRNNGVLIKNEYTFKRFEDKIILDAVVKEYDIDDTGMIDNFYKFYDNAFLLSSKFTNRRAIRIVKINGKTLYTDDSVDDEFRECDDMYSCLFDIANNLLNKDRTNSQNVFAIK